MSEERFAILGGGGTAGHVLPALAIGEAIVERGRAASSLLFVGSKRGVETSLVPQAGFEVRSLPGRGIVRGAVVGNVSSLVGLAVAAIQAVLLVRRARPKVVVSVGGYAAFPAASAAVVLRVPLVQVNVDAVPGAVNRAFGRFARANAVALETTDLPRRVVTGAPVRSKVVEAREEPVERARSRMGLPIEQKVVLAFGGSLGSRTINDAVAGLRRRWVGRDDVVVYHVVGRRDWARGFRDGLDSHQPGLDYRCVEYEENLPEAMAAADVAVCRAGAMTVAEISVVGVPAVLVPLPGSPGDHQTANAMALCEAGAGVLLPDAECSSERLAQVLDGLLARPAKRASMRAASRARGRPDAASRLAGLVELYAMAGSR